MSFSEFEVETFLRTGAHEAELRRSFGDPLYEELRILADEIAARPPGLERRRRPAYILPGILGSRLSVVANGVPNLVWVDPIELVAGGIRRLTLADGDGVVATGTVFAPYFRMRLRLRLAGYDARFLPYDWRRSPAQTGRALMAGLRREGVEDAVLVCHSMGGLIARAMAAEDPGRITVSRIVTIGTPNHGSYSPVEILALTHGMLNQVGIVDIRNSARDIAQDVLRHFPGLLHMLPDPAKRPDEDYFRSDAWPPSAVRPLKPALEAARRAVAELPPPDDRFFQIVGHGEETITTARQTADGFVFGVSRDGDGTVPRAFAEMGDVPRHYVPGTHGGLCNRGDVIAATIDLIGTGNTVALPTRAPLTVTESLGVEDITAEALAARRTVQESVATLDETDFAGDFLEHPQKTTLDAPKEDAMGPVPSARTAPGAYPVDLLDAARARWETSQPERDGVMESLRNERPLETETPQRLNAYAKRLRTQVDSSHQTGASAIVKDLTTAINVIESQGPRAAPFPTQATAFLERVIGEAEEFLSVMFVKRAVVAARAVGRVVDSDTRRGFGTGFLVAPGILMTNHHVLEEAKDAQKASIQFLYELEIDSRETTGHIFKLEPDRLFHSDETLDMAIVAVAPLSLDGTPLTEFGKLPLVSAEGKIRKGQPVNIVQHPLAGRKQIVFRESTLIALPEDADHVAHYTGDTQPGSSGSPVFSDRWEVVALHHSGVPEKDAAGEFVTKTGTPWNRDMDPEGNTLKWVANEGIRISRIMRHLDALPDQLDARGKPGSDLVRAVLAISQHATLHGVFFVNGDDAPGPESAAPRPRPDRARNGADREMSASQGVVVTVPLRIHVDIGQPTRTT